MDNKSFVTLFKERLCELAELYSSRDKSLTEDEFYENHRVSDIAEEDFVSRELCEYIDAFYDKRHEYKSSGLSSDEWFENEIDKIIIELFPNSTETEKEQFKRIIADKIDEQSEEQVAALRSCIKDIANIAKGKEDCDESCILL